MGTRSKGKRSRKARSDPQPNQPAAEQPQTASSATSTDAQGASPSDDMIRKGVYLSALVYVEGYQKPPDDFNSTTITALKKMLNDCLASPPDGLTMKLKSVDVQNDVEQDDDGGGDTKSVTPSKKKEEKFQF